MKLVFVVKSDKEKKRFYFWLPAIKLLRFCEIELKGKDSILSSIETALSIKSRRDRLAYIYDEACSYVDKSLASIENPCQFLQGKCRVQRCNGSKKVNGCCNRCRYQSSQGCKTKNLACKLFFCSEVTSRYKTITFDEIPILKVLSFRQRFLLRSDYFASREEVLSDIYSGLLIFGGMRIIIRFIAFFVIYKKND